MSRPRFFDAPRTFVGGAAPISSDQLMAKVAPEVIRVRVNAEPTENDVWTAEALVNLLARLYPTIQLEAGALNGQLERLAKAIHPGITIDTDLEVDSTACAAIGPGDGGSVSVQADGWVVSVDWPCSERGPSNPFAAATAACLAAARIFRRVFGYYNDDPPRRISLLDFSDTAGKDRGLPDADLGQVALVGLGAVANGAVWCLSRYPGLRGDFLGIDGQKVDWTNLQRYALCGDLDVGCAKTEIARRELSGLGRRFEAFDGVLEDVPAEKLSAIPTLCVSPDSIHTRHHCQALLPKLLVNGSTGSSNLAASWHRFDGANACLSCVYLPTRETAPPFKIIGDALGLDETRATWLWLRAAPLEEQDVRALKRRVRLTQAEEARCRTSPIQAIYREHICSGGEVNQDDGQRVVVPLAHQSMLAGALMGAELLKRLVPSLDADAQSAPEIVIDDIMRAPPPASAWPLRTARRDECICNDPDYRTVYSEKWLKPA